MITFLIFPYFKDFGRSGVLPGVIPGLSRKERQAEPVPERKTRVSIDGEDWLINGEPTYRGRTFRGWRIEGLLLNSRMASGIFDDENPLTRDLWKYPDTGVWDAD
ncbi:MAG: hypothetical protein IIC30_07735, partial [Chloroflexi bacterium]|nr:hypothetical protein [Chloroflexota bacterium]